MKKRIGQLILLVITVFTLTGCTNYLQKINYKELEKMIDNKETFILEITQDGCSHCEEFTPRLKSILEENKIKAYNLNITYIEEKDYEKLDEKYNLKGTPTTMFFKNGKELINSRLTGSVSDSKIKAVLQGLDYIKK